jgi:hypothetical protein
MRTSTPMTPIVEHNILTGTRAAALALLMGLGLAAAGCAKGTYLEVSVTGTNIPEIHSIVVTLVLTPTDGGQVLESQGPVGNNGAAIKLPTSFAFKLDSENGSLQVSAVAFDGSGKPVAVASNNTTIMHGQTWTIVLNLAPS